MRFVYLAYPIDAVEVDAFEFARVQYAKDELIAHGVEIIYDPGDAFTVRVDARLGREIQHLNTVALNKATGLLAFLPKAIPSVGVPQEVAQAQRAGIPVAVVTDHRSWNLVHPRTQVFGLDQWEEAATWLAAHEDVGSIQSQNSTLLVKVADGGVMPTKAYPDDAGFDLYVAKSTTIMVGQFVDVDCGVSVQFPQGVFGQIVGRSSTLRKRGLLVNTGIIDTGYTGPLFAGVHNLGHKPVTVEKGERIAQLLLHSNWQWIETRQVDELGSSSRGTAGFGSSGL